MNEREGGVESSCEGSAEAVNALFAAVRGASTCLIVTHDDPDPDAIASALALGYLLHERLGLRVTLAHGGIIGRAENKAMVHLLAIDIAPLYKVNPQRFDVIGLVDAQAGAGNVSLPDGVTPTVLVDHHSDVQSDPADISFVDIRSSCGATSTMLTNYLKAAGLPPDRKVATALFYGIKSDTMGLARSAGDADVEAYLYLLPLADNRILAEIEQAQVPLAYFRAFERALERTFIYQDVVISGLGEMDWPDLAAEMADFLLRWEGARWIICMGVFEDKVVISVRTNDLEGNAGLIVQQAVSGLGTGGGHGLMAGGRVPLNGQSPRDVVRELRGRFLRLLGRDESNGEKLIQEALGGRPAK